MYISKKKYEQMRKDIFELKVMLGSLCNGIVQDSKIEDPDMKKISEEVRIGLAIEFKETLRKIDSY